MDGQSFPPQGPQGSQRPQLSMSAEEFRMLIRETMQCPLRARKGQRRGPM